MDFHFTVSFNDEQLEQIKNYLNTDDIHKVAVNLADFYSEGAEGFLTESVELDSVPVLRST